MRFCTFPIKALGRTETIECGKLAVWMATRISSPIDYERVEFCRDHIGQLDASSPWTLTPIKS